MSELHEANRKGWDAISPQWQAMIERGVDWRRCPDDPSIALHRQEFDHLGDVSGKDVCVLGSGDNLVVFALAGMGARVTSVDISQVQLDTAADRAGELGLDIAFIRADVTDLKPLSDRAFDVVYTGGHVAVWVSDLKRYYMEAVRILKGGGMFIVGEYHPFRRIWLPSPDQLQIEFGYFDKEPQQYDRAEYIPGTLAGSLPSFEFMWTVGDHVSAVLDAGCDLLAFEEFGDESQHWEEAPLAGLPHYMSLVGRKR